MSFNDSFQNMEFINEENPNNLSFGQEDVKMDLSQEKKLQKNSYINNIINTNNDNDNYNNIFSSLAMELESDDNNYSYNRNNDYYIDILSKELIKYNISNIINILRNKTIIIKSKIFYFLKDLYIIKLTKSIKSEILFLKILSIFNIISSIFNKHKINTLYQIFYIIKRKYIYNKDKKDININNISSFALFKSNYELNYKKEKDDIIKRNTNNIKSIEKDIQLIKKNINQLTAKEMSLKAEIYSYLQKEKKLNEQIKNIESNNNSLKKLIQSSDTISTRSINKNDSDVISLEKAINTTKKLKEEKEEVIKIFMDKVYKLLDEYQVYINNIKKCEESSSNNNLNNLLNSQNNIGKDTNDNSPFSSNFSSKNLSNEL
jgi:hypothetical protein